MKDDLNEKTPKELKDYVLEQLVTAANNKRTKYWFEALVGLAVLEKEGMIDEKFAEKVAENALDLIKWDQEKWILIYNKVAYYLPHGYKENYAKRVKDYL